MQIGTARIGIAAALTALALAVPAAAKDPVEVDATGNPFTGGLGYDPAAVDASVGQKVRWTNADFFVPHTATEKHGLWDLAGDYGIAAISPTGFGPGESVERRFEAGAWSYYCRVHGADAQSGTVDVPVALRSRRVGQRRYAVTARWSRSTLAEGQVVDVQVKRRGEWQKAVSDTTALALRTSRLRKGTTLAFRARVHMADDPAAASGWSPAASITTGERRADPAA